MENLQTLSLETIKDLTPEKILGLPELIKSEYTDQEILAIKMLLFEFANSKNENYEVATVETWINNFAEMRLTPAEILKRIRLAKLEKKYGVTEFAIFMNVRIDSYTEFYKHVRLNQNTIDPVIEKLNKEIQEKEISL